MKYYEWQKQIIEHKGNVTIRGGRQTGKSEAVAERIWKCANDFPSSRILLIAASERQENYLLEKLKIRIGEKYVGRATLTRIELKNKTQIYKFPVGKTGVYIEGLSSVDFLFVDEAIHLGKKVWDSVIPMLAEPRKRGLGWITLLSATNGKPEGFFYESFERKDFLQIQIKAEDCPHISKEFLESEKKRLGELMYGVIYNGEFSEESYRYFQLEIISRCAKIGIWNYQKDFAPELKYFLGIDPARFGKSKAAFVVVELNKEGKVRVVHFETIAESSLIDLYRKTKNLDALFKFRKIYVDDGGVGAGLVDIFIDDKMLKRKIKPMNNASAGKENRILKEDLYSNALKLMETEKIELPAGADFLNDLHDVEFDEEGKIKGTDISEALVRACWCTKERNLKPLILSF